MAVGAIRRKVSTPPDTLNVPGGKTTWKAGVPAFGWYKVADQWWRDLPRLQRGLYQRMLIDYAWGCTVPREDGVAVPDWSPPLSWSDMAAMFRCSPAQLHDDARDAHERGLIEIKGYKGKGERFENRGNVQIRVLWQNWGNIKDYTPPKPQMVERQPAPKVASHWFSRRVTVAPGESYDFTVPDLPSDFTLQKISFRNTGDTESVTIAGGGPAEGGVIVLETEAEKSGSVKSETYGKKRESTPQREKPQKRESTPQSPPKIEFSSPLAKTLAKYGIVSDISLNRLVAECQAWASGCSLDEIEQAARVIGDGAAENPKTRSVSAIVLSQVPFCFKTGSFVAPVARKGSAAQTERERMADEIWGSGRKKRA